MNNEMNKKIVARYYEEVLTQRNYETLNEILAPNFTAHGPNGYTVNSPEYLASIKSSHAAFPDLRVCIEDQIAADDKVVTRFTAKGTHRGSYFGIPATGKEVRIEAIHIHRLGNGLIEELWEQINIFGALQQLGALPK